MDENLIPTTPPTIQEPPKNKAGFIILIVALILICVSVAGYFTYYKGLFCNFSTILYKQTQPIVVTDQFAGWQTYKNEEYGFEIKYPTSFEPFQNLDQKHYINTGIYEEDRYTKYKNKIQAKLSMVARTKNISSSNIYLNVFNLNEFSYVDIPGGVEFGYDPISNQWWSDNGDGKEKTSIPSFKTQNGIGYLLGSYDAGAGEKSGLIPINENNIMVEISITDGEGYTAQPPFDQILSTFKFVQ